jgi:hypothetical protein
MKKFFALALKRNANRSAFPSALARCMPLLAQCSACLAVYAMKCEDKYNSMTLRVCFFDRDESRVEAGGWVPFFRGEACKKIWVKQFD